MLARTLALICLLPLSAQAGQLGPSLSGDARMGLAWSDRPAQFGPRETGLRMTSRARLHLQFMGQTDGGMTYGANIRLDEQRRPRPTVSLGGS